LAFFRFFFTCCADICKAWLYNAEDHGEILLIRHLNPAVLICVVAPEYVCQSLEEEQAFRLMLVGHKESVLS
jgi:hypothetical protein